MTFYADWKAFYAAKARNFPPWDPLTPFVEYLHTDTTPTNAALELVDDMMELVALLPTDDGKIKIVHQFRYDRRSPANPTGSNSLWALVGCGAMAYPVQLDMRLLNSCSGLAPTYAELSGASNAEAVKALTHPARESRNTPKFEGKKMVVIPHFLVAPLIDANTEDAAELLVVLCRALADFDATHPEGVSEVPADDEGGDAVTKTVNAKTTFGFLAEYLYLVAKELIKGHDLPILTMALPQTWALKLHQDRKVGLTATAPTPAAPAPPTGGGGGGDVNLAAALQRNAEELKRSNDRNEKKDSDDKAKKEGVKRLHPIALKTILNASEPLPADAMNENGDALTERNEPVDTYLRLLQQPSTGDARMEMMHHFNVQKQCNIDLPLSTVTAVHTGRLLWENLELPEAFSLSAI